MLNHRGGRILFGVGPDHSVLGQSVRDRTLEEFAQELRGIDRPVYPTIERVPVGDGNEVLVATVSQVPNRPATGWRVTDLDASEFRRTVEEAIRRGRAEDPGTRDPAELLRSFGLVKDGELLRAAVVLFDRPERIEAELSQRLLRWRDFLRQVAQTPAGHHSLGMLWSWILRVTDVPREELHRAVVTAIGPAAGETVMSTAERIEQAARAEARVELLLRLVTTRFGALSQAIVDHIRLGISQGIDRWADRVLFARTLDEVFARD